MEKIAKFINDHRVRVAQDIHVYFKKGEEFRVDHIYVADIDNVQMVAIHKPGYSPICVEAFRLEITTTNKKFNPNTSYI